MTNAQHFAFARKSRNAKTGDIPVTTSDAKTCPDACPLKYATDKQGNVDKTKPGACYAKFGPLGMYWAKINGGQFAMSFADLVQSIASLPQGQLWRHNQAGDLPGIGDSIDGDMLYELVKANHGKRGFTYTHKPVTGDGIGALNRSEIANANKEGFTVNLSADSLAEADELKALNIGPVVTILPRDAKPVTYTPNGHKVITCPAQTREDVSCKTCGLCAIGKRDVIIGFLAHGVSAKRAESIALS